MLFVLSAAASLILIGAPYCPAGHSQAECDAAWDASQAVAATTSRSSARDVRAAAAAARDEVTKDLADPESARFRNVRAFQMKPGAAIIFCGEINAKNQLGGYTGYRPFVALNGTSVIAGADSMPAIAAMENAMVLNACTAKPLLSYGKVTF